jgi:hypothetical protein
MFFARLTVDKMRFYKWTYSEQLNTFIGHELNERRTKKLSRTLNFSWSPYLKYCFIFWG